MATHEELFEVALAELLAVNPLLSDTVARTQGSSTNAALHAIASPGEEVAWQALERFRQQFLDTASGPGLRRLVADRYAITVKGATAAVVELLISRTVTTADLTVPAGKEVTDPDRSVKFRLDADVELPIGVSSATGIATSTSAGSDQTVAAAALTQWIGGAPQSDATVTNSERSSGGNDAEDDGEIKARARAVWVTAARGTLDALRQGTLQIEQVRRSGVFEPVGPDGRPFGEASVIVADAEGHSNATLEEDVRLELEEWRGAGIWVEVGGGTRVDRDISVVAIFSAGSGTIEAKSALRRAIVALVNRLEPNPAATAALAPAESILSPGLVESAKLLVPGVVKLTSLDPTADEAPEHGEVFRTTFGRVTVT